MHGLAGRIRNEGSLVAVASFVLPIALVALYLAARHPTLAALLRSLGFGDTPLHDYRAFFYPMGRQLLDAPRPIAGFLYSPFAALVFVPLAALPYPVSAWVWAGVLLSATLVLAREAHALARGERWLGALAVGLTVASVPVLHDLKFGQVSLLVVAALLACATLYAERRFVAAALCLSLAISFKFYPALFLSYFVLRRDVRFVLLVLGMSLALMLLLPIGVLGARETLAFYADVAAQLHERFGSQVADPNAQSLAAVARRTLGGSPLARGLTVALRYLSWAGILVVASRLAQARESHAVRRGFLWLFVATPFFVATSWPHYFVYLPAVFVAALAAARALPAGRRRQVVLAAVSLGALLSSVFFFDLVGNRKLYVRYGGLFWSNAAALVALVALLRCRALGSVARA